MATDSNNPDFLDRPTVSASTPRFELASNRALVAAADGGDRAAWEELVERYAGLIEAVARSHRLSGDDVGDVAQMVWLALLSNLGRLYDPERVGLWIHTTARRECLAALRRRDRHSSFALRHDDLVDDGLSPSEAVLRAERARQLHLALAMMEQQCRLLLELLLLREPPARYEEISDRCSIAVGTIGPRRRRCLNQLRRLYSAIDASWRQNL